MKKAVLLVIILSFSNFAFAQKTAEKVFTEKERRLQAQKIQAIYLATKSADEALNWENKKLAIEVLADASELLWNEDSVQSEKWLVKAWKFIDQVEESNTDGKMNEFFTPSEKAGLRTQVLTVARKRAPKLAEQFLKQIAEQEPEAKKDRGAFDDKTARSEQLLSLAQQLVETDPNTTFSLAERSLADGISFKLQTVLTSLRQKNPTLANRLFDLALARLLSNPQEPSDAQVLAGYLFRSGFTFAANSTGQMILAVNPAQQNLPAVASQEPIRTRNFLVAVYQLFFTRPVLIDTPESRRRASDIFILGNSVGSQFEIHAPELAQQTRVFLAQLGNALNPNGSPSKSAGNQRLAELPKNATAEETYEALIADLEEKAEKETDVIAKKLAYVKAANATKPEDYKRGVRIAKNIEDAILQDDLVSFLLYRAALHFVNVGQIETAEELSPQIKEVLRRSVVKIAVAQGLLEPKKAKDTEKWQIDFERQRAFDLINEVQKELEKEESSENLAKISLGATALSAKFDATQGFGSLEQTIRIINKVEDFGVRSDSAPKLGIDLSTNSAATVANPRIGFGFRAAIETLIEADFDQVVLAVERISDKQVRGVARLEASKMFLMKFETLLKRK